MFFHLLRIGLDTEKPFGELAECNWHQIYALGVKQGVAAILFDGLQRLIDAHIDIPLPDKKLKMQWYAHTLQVEKHHRQQEHVISSLAEFYSEHGIKMMILKGYGVSLLYPTPNHRPCGDIDIWQFGDEERGDNLLHEKLGIQIDYSHHHHTVFTCNGVAVENHYDFVNQHSSLSNRDFEEEMHRLIAKHKAEAVMINGQQVYIPSATFNAVFLMRHMGQHFASTEIAVRHLVDWAMFVKHYHQDVDWQWLEQFAKKQKMFQFLCCINALCVDYIGLPANVFPMWERDKALEGKIMNDILLPAFAEQPPVSMGVIQDKIYRFRRWWNNRWKRKLVFRENLLLAFVVLLRSHLIKPRAYKSV